MLLLAVPARNIRRGSTEVGDLGIFRRPRCVFPRHRRDDGHDVDDAGVHEAGVHRAGVDDAASTGAKYSLKFLRPPRPSSEPFGRVVIEEPFSRFYFTLLKGISSVN